MRAKVFCMASAKGGSGKTLLTTTFGTFLASLGKKVLLVDTDAATNGLTLLHLREVRIQADRAISDRRVPRGVYEAVTSDQLCEIVSLDTGVDLVPALYSFSNTEGVDVDVYQMSLISIIAALRPKYDYIFVDAQAGSDVYAQVAMSRGISDQVIIVSEYDPMSAAGVERLKAIMPQDLTYDRTWYLLNKMLPEFVQSFSDFLEVAKYLTPVPWDAEVVKAYARRKIALDLNEGNEHTLAVMQTVRALLQEEIEAELTSWTESRAAKIRTPLLEQYRDTELELQALLNEERRNSDRVRRIKRRLQATTLFPLALVLMIVISDLLLPEIAVSETVKDIVSGAGILLLFVYVLISSRVEGRSEVSLDAMRRQRRVRVLEERLTKLEAIREGSLEQLIRNRHF